MPQFLVLLKSYKTNIAAATFAILGFLTQQEYIGAETFTLLVSIAGAFGFYMAKDGDRTSEQLGVKAGKPLVAKPAAATAVLVLLMLGGCATTRLADRNVHPSVTEAFETAAPKFDRTADLLADESSTENVDGAVAKLRSAAKIFRQLSLWSTGPVDQPLPPM